MSERAALVRAVIQSPEDDTARLVFADWLEEHGETERSEFIRIQCEIARTSGAEGDRLAGLARREKELWQAHRASWCDELPKWARGRVYFRRGFPAVLSCTQTQWLDARGLVRRAPIEALAVSYFYAHRFAAFAATSHLAGVRTLRLGVYSHGDRTAVVRELSRSACARGLRVLDLNRGGFTHNSTQGDPAATALADANLSGLQCLRLSMGEIGPAGVAALAASPSLSGLRMLDLSENPVGVAGARALAESPHLGNLTALCLADSRLTDRGVETLARSPRLARLTHLNLRDGDLTASAVEAVAGSPYLTRLTALSFHFAQVRTDGARFLAGSPNLAGLTYLNLFGGIIGDEGLRALLESPYLTQLRTLELGANGLTAGGLRAMARAPAMANLEHLGLWGTPNVDLVVPELQVSPNLPRLRHIGFYPNWLENATRQEIDEHLAELHGETVLKRL